MVLVAKQKKKPSIHHKRRHGKHQHDAKDFHKPYWPYLPIFAVMGAGAIANAWLSAPVQQSTFATVQTFGLTRMQSWFNKPSQWLLMSILLVAVAAALLVIVRHAQAWKRAFVKSEAFILHHPFLDIALIALAVSGFVVVGNLV